MATTKTPAELEQERLLQQQELGKAAPASGVAQDAFTTPTSASPTATTPSAAPSLSGGFVNVEKYRQVNDASAKAMAKGLGTEAGAKFGGAETELGNAATAAQNSVAAGAVNVNDIPKEGLFQVNKLNDAQMATTKRALNGYDGINSFQDSDGYKKYSTLYDKAAQEANQYNDSGYRAEILRNNFNTDDVKRNGGYTAGMANLDNDLVDSKANLVASGINQANTALTSKATAASNDIAKRIDATKASANQTRDYVKDTLGKSKATLVATVNNDIANRNATNAEIARNLANPLGKVEKVEDGADFSVGDVLDDRQRAEAARLKELLGEDVLSDMDKRTGKYIKVRDKVIPKPVVKTISSGGNGTRTKQPTITREDELR